MKLSSNIIVLTKMNWIKCIYVLKVKKNKKKNKMVRNK